MASLNFELISIFTSWPVFRNTGTKNSNCAFEIAISIGVIDNNGSSSFNVWTVGYVLAISDLIDIAEGVDSSIICTSAPLRAILEAIL